MTTLTAYELYRWAEALFTERDYTRAAGILERLLADHPQAPHLAQVRELLARSYYHSAQLEKSAAAARELLEADPTHAYAALLLARSLERAGKSSAGARRLVDVWSD